MLTTQNKRDKVRFEKHKNAHVKLGRHEDEAIWVAAAEIKELRRREGRSREGDWEKRP
jgi:hypothetical protein